MALLLAIMDLPGLCQGEERVAWGEPVGGVRLGISLVADETVRLVFQNTGEVERDLLIGGLTGIGPTYSMEFASRGPDGKDRKVFPGGVGHVAGHLEPIVVGLPAGGTHQLLLPLKGFVCVINRETVALKELLRQGCSVRASLTVTADAAKWSRSKKPWIGRVVSGNFVTSPGAP